MAEGKKAVVLGAGFAGLWIAKRLVAEGYRVEVLEKSAQAGGLMESFEQDGFLFDLGPHILVPSHQDSFRALLGNDLIQVRGYYGFGLGGKQIYSPLTPGNLLRTLGPLASIPLVASMVWHRLPLVGPHPPWESVEPLLLAKFGTGVYDAFFRDYVPKVTGVPTSEVSEDWFMERYRFYKEHSMWRQLLQKGVQALKRLFQRRGTGTSAGGLELYYPKKGAQMVTDALLSEITRAGAVVRLGARVSGIQATTGRGVQSVAYETEGGGGGGKAEGDLFVSTLPVTHLSDLFGGALGSRAATACRELGWRHLWLFFVQVDTERVSDKIQVYFTEKQYPFKRIYEPKTLLSSLAPPRRTALCVEVCYSDGDAIDRADEGSVFRSVQEGICSFYGLSPTQVRLSGSRRVPYSYAVYREGYRTHLHGMAEALFPLFNFISYGRQGSFRYNYLVDRIVDAADSVMACFAAGEAGKRETLGKPDAKSDFF